MTGDKVSPEPTLKWFRRSGSDAEAYHAHLSRLAPELPASLRLLSEGGGALSLHDAWLIDSRQTAGSIVLDIAAYDYARDGLNRASVDLHVRIEYRDAVLHGPSVDQLWLWRRSGVEILAGEFDHDQFGRFIHRFLVFPESADAMAISFSTAELVAVEFNGTDVFVVSV